MKLDGLSITVIIVFVANIIIGAFTVNIPSMLGWSMATIWYLMYLDLRDAECMEDER